MTRLAAFTLVITVTLAPALHAQTEPGTNAEILARIAVLEQQIASLRSQLVPAAPVVVVVPHRQTLGEASAAAQVHHEWPMSQHIGTAAIRGLVPKRDARKPASVVDVAPRHPRRESDRCRGAPRWSAEVALRRPDRP